MKQETDFIAIYESPEFDRLVWHRRKLVSFLMFLSMGAYFAIPLITATSHELMSVKLIGPINFGLVYLVGQYVFGAVIAIYYARRLRRLDEISSSLVLKALTPDISSKKHGL